MTIWGVDATQSLHRSRVVGLLTTYRREGEPVATPVSIAVESGKARRLRVRPDVTDAASTIGGTVTGPTIEGRANLLSCDQSQR